MGDIATLRRRLGRWLRTSPVETAFSAALPPRTQLHDEATCLAAARRGEPWALEQLYHRHQPQLFALCYRLLERAEDAEDAVQATFVRAFRALPRFRGESSARTWLYRIATNEALGILRRRREAPPLEEAEPSTADRAAAVVERLAVRAALARLSPDHRSILVLRLWEELSYTEIAAVLGISLPAVKMRLNRARAEFRKYYEESV
jgi:RNA polymerase sigma-70 factor (ECF subfamily)